MANENRLLKLIPIGEEHAVPARAIWEAQDDRVWTTSTVKGKLNALVKSGCIERKHLPAKTSGVVSVYFRRASEIRR